MFSPVSFFPFQLWINQASSDFSHVSYLSRGHANCNGKPIKALPVGEDTSELIQALQETSDGLTLCMHISGSLPGLRSCGFEWTCMH